MWTRARVCFCTRTDDHGVFGSDLVSPEKQATLVLALLPATCLNVRSRLHFLGLLDYDQGGGRQQACSYDTALTLGTMKVNPPEILICQQDKINTQGFAIAVQVLAAIMTPEDDEMILKSKNTIASRLSTLTVIIMGKYCFAL